MWRSGPPQIFFFLKHPPTVHSLGSALGVGPILVHRTFGVGAREPQLLDLRGPRHGRQHLEGVLAVDLAVANVELQQSPKHLEVLELACMRPRGREVEKRVGSALSATPKKGKFHRKSGLVRNPREENFSEHSPVIFMGLPYVPDMSTYVSCGQFSSTLMSPA